MGHHAAGEQGNHGATGDPQAEDRGTSVSRLIARHRKAGEGAVDTRGEVRVDVGAHLEESPTQGHPEERDPEVPGPLTLLADGRVRVRGVDEDHEAGVVGGVHDVAGRGVQELGQCVRLASAPGDGDAR